LPELPEVETTRRGIMPQLTARTATAVIVREGRLRRPVPPDLPQLLTGQTLLGVSRRGKYLLLAFESGTLLVHLGMSGSLRIVAPSVPPEKHDHVDIRFSDRILRYRDPRRFGLMLWLRPEDGLHPLLAGLGVEPLSAAFDGGWLHAQTRGARTAVKLFLMDSHRIVGVGNIYASESLFRAAIHPSTAAGMLGPKRCDRLAAAVRTTLEAAIAAGGSSLRDFVQSDSQPGYFQQQYFVYGRKGEPCRICGSPIRHLVMGQRASFFCGHCQRR
jgi:formamidopyrimidine-DNA glycosylase